jgi:hypothetical protein
VQLSQIASTVPANGDVNPYGVAAVPASAGKLTAGNFLVSNYNDKAPLADEDVEVAGRVPGAAGVGPQHRPVGLQYPVLTAPDSVLRLIAVEGAPGKAHPPHLALGVRPAAP